MPRPDLQQLAHWLDPTLIALLEERRHQKKEWRRHRKLGTLETLLLRGGLFQGLNGGLLQDIWHEGSHSS